MAVNGADSGCCVGRGGHGGLECRSVLGRNRGKDAAAGLGVAEHQLVELRDAAPIDLVAIGLVIAPASGRKEVALCELANPIEEWHRTDFDVGAPGQVAQVSDQSV